MAPREGSQRGDGVMTPITSYVRSPGGVLVPPNHPFDAQSARASGAATTLNAPETQIRGAGPDAWFGPMQPMAPFAPPGTGGRQWDYPYGLNLLYTPRGESDLSFATLRAFADALPDLRIGIEHRKAEVAAWQWDVQPILTAKDRRKASAKPPADDPRVADVKKYFHKPDRRHHFAMWLGALIEDMLVVDAACIYPRMTWGGDLYSLDLIDGTTIKPLIDEGGRQPMPEDGPAFQQVLHGVPAADFTFDELMYLPRNIRSGKLYGFSAVEWIILTINIALRRQVYMLDYYTEGSIPQGFYSLPKEWGPDQIASFQRWWDDILAGNLAARRRLQFMPGGADGKYTETKQAPLKDVYDEWLMRIICAALNVSPSPYVNDNTRATAQSIQLQTSQRGIESTKLWIKAFLDDIIQDRLGYEDLEFVWSGSDEVDPLEQAQALQVLISCGVKTVDEGRVELGLDPFGIGPTTQQPVIPLIESYKAQVEDITNPKPPPVLAPPSGQAPRPGGGATAPPGGAQPPSKTEQREEPRPTAAKADAQTLVNGAGVMFRAPTGAVLFLRRTRKDGDAGQEWAFPGGGIEDGETGEQAAARESDEEVGRTPGKLTHAYTAANGYKTFESLVAREFEPKLNGEHDDFVWAPPSRPPSPLHPGVTEFLLATGLLPATKAALDQLAAAQSFSEAFGSHAAVARDDGERAAVATHRHSLVDVPVRDLSAITADEAKFAQSFGHVLVGDNAERFSGRHERITGVDHPHRGVDVPPSAVVQERVVGVVDGLKVARRVVSPNAVDMVGILGRQQVATEGLRQNAAMLGNRLARETVPPVAASGDVSGSSVVSIARMAAEQVLEALGMPVRAGELTAAAASEHGHHGNISHRQEVGKAAAAPFDGGRSATKYSDDQPRDEHGRWSGSGATYDAGSKQWTRADGSPLPDHLAGTRIPPAWSDVKFSEDPKSELLVVGKDEKGRPQYVYSDEHWSRVAAEKFARVDEMESKYQSIMAQNEANRASGDANTQAHADALETVAKMGIRPGSETDTKAEKQAYGATTLMGSHVVQTEGGVRLQFTGKKGVDLNLPVTDKGLADRLVARAEAAGPDGKLFPGVSDASLRDYTHTMDGGDFKPKDFRTRLANDVARTSIASMKAPTDEKSYQSSVRAVAKDVSTRLGNTPTVALVSYINPAVFGRWRMSAKV